MFQTTKIKIFAGSASKYLAEQISNNYGENMGICKLQRYFDGEMQPCFDESIRGNIVFIVQSTMAPSDNLMELLLMIDAAKRASAYKVVAVIPYFGYGRQDRKDKPRVSIGAKLVANLLTAAGVDRVISIDMHADAIQGFFDVPVDHLYASSIFVPYIRSLNLENIVVVAPDMGGTKRASAYSKVLDAELAICYKERTKANYVDNISIIGEVRDKNVIIVDDIIDTAGTISIASRMIKKKGAKSIRVFATHPILSGNAMENIEKSEIDEIVVSDTIPMKKDCKNIKILSVATLLSDVVSRIHDNKSISEKFIL